MDTRTAPQWIREAEKRYGRARRVWHCLTAIAVLGWLGWAFIGVYPHASWGRALVLVCVVVFVVWRPDKPATRYPGEAIARYEYESAATEGDPDAADRRASGVLFGAAGGG